MTTTRPRTYTDLDIEDVLAKAEPLLAKVDEGLAAMRQIISEM